MKSLPSNSIPNLPTSPHASISTWSSPIIAHLDQHSSPLCPCPQAPVLTPLDCPPCSSHQRAPVSTESGPIPPLPTALQGAHLPKSYHGPQGPTKPILIPSLHLPPPSLSLCSCHMGLLAVPPTHQAWSLHGAVPAAQNILPPHSHLVPPQGSNKALLRLSPPQ